MSPQVRAREELPRERSSPRRVRAMVARALRDAGLDGERVRLTQLLASELATNAVVHGRGERFVVDLAADEAAVTVRVHDDGDRPLRRRAREPGLQQGGWGLDLVERLSSGWGCEPSGSGKVVWFTVERGER